MFGPGFYMMNGYTVNDYRPAQNVSKLFSAVNGYGVMKAQGDKAPAAMIIGYCVSLEDLNGMQFQVLPKVDLKHWDEVYDSRDPQPLPNPEGNVWTPGHGEHSHLQFVLPISS